MLRRDRIFQDLTHFLVFVSFLTVVSLHQKLHRGLLQLGLGGCGPLICHHGRSLARISSLSVRQAYIACDHLGFQLLLKEAHVSKAWTNAEVGSGQQFCITTRDATENNTRNDDEPSWGSQGLSHSGPGSAW